MTRAQRAARDRGSGSVLVVGVLGVLMTITAGGVAVVAAVVAGHRATAAADLAALAAAGAMARGEPVASACAAGSEVAGRNGAALSGCRADSVGAVEVEARVAATPSWVGVATARARAGPVPDDQAMAR